MRTTRRSAAPTSEADYVVVGAGSSGCALAGRLAASGASVILLEAGGTDERFAVRKPGMVALLTVPRMKARVDWGYYTLPQQHALDRRIPYTRGRLVGGSGSVNGMVYVRGNRADYDSWAAEGNAGWSADEVNIVYKRMEDFEDGEDAYRGAGGPIKVTRSSTTLEPSMQFIQATADTLGVKILDDYNGELQEGVSRFQQNVSSDGVRYSSSRGYLQDVRHRFLDLQSQVRATRIVIENGRAVGVEVLDRDRTRRTVHAGKEVIVSAGALNSPQLLMLSGIGPAAHLREHGIPVVADLPVGRNLHDHLQAPITFDVPSVRHRSSPAYFLKNTAIEVARGSTFLANSLFEAVAFLRTSRAGALPDLQLHMLPWGYPSPNQDVPANPVDPRPSMTIMSTLITPRSRGVLRLASADPTAAPLLDFNYLSQPEDLATLLEGVSMIRDIMGAAHFGGGVRGELAPGAHSVGEDLEADIRNRVCTVYHAVGTCRMGVDERAVVTPDCSVRGIEHLRVVDASIMPSITRGNTNAASMMIGDRAADFVLADR